MKGIIKYGLPNLKITNMFPELHIGYFNHYLVNISLAEISGGIVQKFFTRFVRFDAVFT